MLIFLLWYKNKLFFFKTNKKKKTKTENGKTFVQLFSRFGFFVFFYLYYPIKWDILWFYLILFEYENNKYIVTNDDI